MTWQDGEQIIQTHKELSRQSAGAYLMGHSEKQSVRQPNLRTRMLASIGGALVVVGYRLQSGYEQMAVTTLESADNLRLSRNGSGPGGC